MEIVGLSASDVRNELNVSSEEGIGWIELRGSALVIDGICWDCADGPAPSESRFRRDDVNLDGRSDLSDPLTILGYLFLGGLEPTSLAALDFNDSAAVDLADPIGWLNWLLLGGPRPSRPYAMCGPDPTPDALGCEIYGGC